MSEPGGNKGRQDSIRWVFPFGSMVFMLFFFAGPHPAFWAPIAGLSLICLAVLVLSGRIAIRVPGRKWWILLTALPALPLVQSVPLPEGFLSVLSPKRAEWIFQVKDLLGVSSTASLSYVPWETVFIAGLWFFFVLYGLMLRDVLNSSSQERSRLILFFFLIAFFQSLYGILQVLVPSLGVLWESSSSGRVARGTFINRNNFAAFLSLLWPVFLAYTLKPSGRQGPQGYAGTREIHHERRQKKVFFGFVTGFVLFALFFSVSRAGILTVLFAATIFVILTGNRERKELLLAVAGSWIVLIAYGTVLGFDEILARFDRLENDMPGRFRLWWDTWTIIQDHPWTGIGLGAFREVYGIYQTHLSEFEFARHAHNDYLQWIAELGWPLGLTGIGLLWSFWLRNARRLLKLRRQSASSDISIASGCLAGLAAFLLHAWVDFPFRMAANVLAFLAVMVLLEAEMGSLERLRPGAGCAESLKSKSRGAYGTV